MPPDPSATVVEWCFVVGSASGPAEVRVRSTGDVLVTFGSTKWVSLDGISFPIGGSKLLRHVRDDVARLDTIPGLATAPLNSDRLLYHYTSAETAVRYILKNRTLRMGPLERTNDPREAKEWSFALFAAIGQAAPGESIRVSSELSSLIRRTVRLACFCSDGHPPQAQKVELVDGQGWRHARMWAQYGDRHRGVVLVFDRRRLLDAARTSLNDKGPLLFGDVLYVEHRHPGDMLPFIVDHAEWVKTPALNFAKRHRDLHGDWLFFTKHTDWAQEHESRLVFFGNDLEETFIPIEGALIEICIGELATDPNSKALLDASRSAGCALTRVTWRNGLPIRTPVVP